MFTLCQPILNVMYITFILIFHQYTTLPGALLPFANLISKHNTTSCVYYGRPFILNGIDKVCPTNCFYVIKLKWFCSAFRSFIDYAFMNANRNVLCPYDMNWYLYICAYSSSASVMTQLLKFENLCLRLWLHKLYLHVVSNTISKHECLFVVLVS